MALVNYDPLNLINRMQSEMNDFFSLNGGRRPLSNLLELTTEWQPTVNIEETNDQYIVTADIPGVDPKDIEVTMEDGTLVVKGERKTEREESKASYRLKECSYGSFERRFAMPDYVDDKHITAKNKNGVITITVGKKKAAAPKRIEIKS